MGYIAATLLPGYLGPASRAEAPHPASIRRLPVIRLTRTAGAQQEQPGGSVYTGMFSGEFPDKPGLPRYHRPDTHAYQAIIWPLGDMKHNPSASSAFLTLEQHGHFSLHHMK
jgi:hypothetical protein